MKLDVLRQTIVLLTANLALGAVLFLSVLAVPAVAQQPEVEVLLDQAVLAYDDKQYDRVLDLLAQVLKLDPDNVNALYYAGLAHLAKRDAPLAVQSLEKARAKNPKDLLIRYQLGVAYFLLEQYDKAEPLLTEVFAEQPRLENVGYYVGFMRYRRKDYQGALKAFQSGTTTDPTMQQLTKFYAGLTLGILGLSERAIVEVEESLRIQPASPLTGPAERIRDTIVAARERERRLHAEIRVGGFYDDNVPVNPRPSTDPVAEALRTRPSRSFGELASLRVDYSWLRNGPWESTATYAFFQTINNNHHLGSFNVQDHTAGLSGFYRGAVATLPYQLGVQYNYDYLTLNNAPFLGRHTGTVFGTLVENPGNLTTLVSSVQFKNFLRDATTPPPENRDATNWMAGPTHVFRFDGDRHLFRVGYQFDYEDTKGVDFSYTGHRVLTGGQYTLPWEGGTRLRYDYAVHFRAYTHTNVVLPVTAPNTMRRKDVEQLHVFRIEQPLPDNLTLSLEYQGTFAHSNLAVFDYHRNVFSLVLTWTY